MTGNRFGDLWQRLDDYGLGAWRAAGIPVSAERNLAEGHGDLARWREALAQFPPASAGSVDLDAPTVRVGEPAEMPAGDRSRLVRAAEALRPWRKGPIELFGVTIDAEWRSDMKWARLEQALAPLRGRRILDIGAGNGYYACRMRGAGAASVIGIDPGRLHVVQALAVRRYLPQQPVWILPLSHADLPTGCGEFDTVFSLGVVYHRRDPHAHLAALREHLRPGGEVAIESIVIAGDRDTALIPPGRYARMRNVWYLPSAAHLMHAVEAAGFADVRLIDQTPTTVKEQRTTRWMPFHSLAEALDPNDKSRTVEGWPAPQRALVLGTRP